MTRATTDPCRPPRPATRGLEEAIRYHVRYSTGRAWEDASRDELLRAIALAVRERLVDGLLETEARCRAADSKRLYYLSMEFLIGRLLRSNLQNLGLLDECRATLARCGHDLDELCEAEPDAALGNGGLGRLAACFLDSLATMDMPGWGYGINYEFGLFRQQIENGRQRERPDQWMSRDSPWLIRRLEESVLVPVYGRVAHDRDRNGGYNPMWLDWKLLVGVPYDMPIVGYGGRTVNALRLFAARSSDEFDMAIFNDGDYVRAVEQKIRSESVSKVLYPSDSIDAGRELRLVQEYFLVACAVRDLVRRYRRDHATFDALPGKVAVQLNDTHPALAVPELMRVLVDEYDVPWDDAWDITVATLGYTNHTLMPEALERWPVPMLERVLPRHLQIIFEINRRFLEVVAARWPGDGERSRRMSIVEESSPKQVRMGHLSIAGSHSVNGVAAMHSELVKSELVPDFHELWPERFSNKTNGVTPRRWLLSANPGLARLITASIGDGWVTDLERLHELEPLADDEGFRERFAVCKMASKRALADLVSRTVRAPIDVHAQLDVQVKRLHEYKRQLLNVMHVIHQFLEIAEHGRDLPIRKTYLFAGKAAPGYAFAKLVITLIHRVGQVIEAHPAAREQLRVVFLPDYRVSLAELIIPAAELSEQISTAGMEASGTGNMKFAMNGALTIGTLDGANVEILEAVGKENLYIFGHTVEELRALWREGYDPRARLSADESLRAVVDGLAGDRFCPDEPGLFRPIHDRLVRDGDPYFHLADFAAYRRAQERAALDALDRPAWMRRAVLNVARMGRFSSDRTIREYAEEIWGIEGLGVGDWGSRVGAGATP